MRFGLTSFKIAAVFALVLSGCGVADEVHSSDDPAPAAKLVLVGGGDSVDFGSVRSGNAVSAMLVVENRDAEEVVIDGLRVLPENGPFAIVGDLDQVAPGGTEALELSFAPENKGRHEGVLTIASHTGRGPNAPFEVELVGVAE